MSYIYYILYISTFIVLAARLTYFCVDLEMNSPIISFLIKNHVSGLQDKLLKPKSLQLISPLLFASV